MVKKILWPTDLSENAEKALPHVQSLSRQYQAEIHVLYVIEDLVPQIPWYGELERKRMNEIRDWEKKTASVRLDDLCAAHLKDCPLFIRHVAVGNPAEQILAYAEKEKVDLVVMATKGRAAGEFGFGGVTEKVVKHSSVPVITVPVK